MASANAPSWLLHCSNIPDVLVLDQPFVGLDVQSRETLSDQISKLHQSGMTIVLICDPLHIPNQVDWVLELNEGQLAQCTRRAGYIPKKKDEDISETMEHYFADLQVIAD